MTPKRLNLPGILTSDTRTGVLDFNPHWLDSMGLHVPNHELFCWEVLLYDYKHRGTTWRRDLTFATQWLARRFLRRL